MEYWPESRFYQGRFGRLFRALPALRLTEAEAQAIAERMVETGGGRDQDNPRIPAGYTYLGQFVDHDITFDPASSLQKRNDPDALRNFRTPAFDLDCLYGRGADDQPYLYDWTPGREGRFLIGRGQGGPDELDLPRNAPADVPDDPGSDRPRRALIGDPRNDENVLVAQLHLTMLVFHNRVMDHLDGSAGNGAPLPRELEKLAAKLQDRPWQERFEVAQDIVRWHYQWMVIFDFLRRIVGEETLGHVLERCRSRYGGVEVWAPSLEFYRPKHDAYMPVEFSVAAYRFGHSMIRNTYRLNTAIPPEGARLLIFNLAAAPTGPERLTHLGGFRQLPQFWPIEWRFFFDDLGDVVEPPPFVQRSRRIDTLLAQELSRLPDNVATGIKALAARNLMRGSTMGLPSGQDVAAAMGFQPLSGGELGLGGRPAPLWYYILKEAELGGGERLGPVGGHIVAEVFVGLLAHDASSWLKRRPSWKPFLGREDGTFTMPDLIRFSGHGLKEIAF
jgi:Animal haem peroxidase